MVRGLPIKSSKNGCTERYFTCLKFQTYERLSGRSPRGLFKTKSSITIGHTNVRLFPVLRWFLQLFKAETSRNCLKPVLFNKRDVFLGVFEFRDLKIDFELRLRFNTFYCFFFIIFVYMLRIFSIFCFYAPPTSTLFLILNPQQNPNLKPKTCIPYPSSFWA